MKISTLFNYIAPRGDHKPSPTKQAAQTATASARPPSEPPLLHKQGSSSSFFFKNKGSLNRTWSSMTSSMGGKSFISRKSTSTTLSKAEQAAADYQKTGAQAIAGLVESGAHLAEIWTPVRIGHVLGLAAPVMEAEFSVLKETRIGLLKGLIDQGKVGSTEGKSPLRTTTTDLKSVAMLKDFTQDPDLLDLAKSAREILEMTISEADDKGKERVTFQAFGDPSVFESPARLQNGFDSKSYANMQHALKKISELGERSTTLLKQKFPEHVSSYATPKRKETQSSTKSGRSTEQDKKMDPMFPRDLQRFFRRG